MSELGGLPQVALDAPRVIAPKMSHSVEFFHIYTDEVIDDRHQVSVDCLKSLSEAWKFDYDRIVMIDNYNPTKHILTAEEVLDHLDDQNMLPHFWAYEKDMVSNAQTLLESITNRKLKKSYTQYIQKNNKYPCSLLTASWYLARLGELDHSMIKATSAARDTFVPSERLFNLLPKDYRPVEERAQQVIANSPYAHAVDRIQDWFYPVEDNRVVDLF